MDISGLDFNIFANHPEHSVDLDYRGIRIKIYKNGDQYDRGTVVVICRKRFKHWLTFLDFLTRKLSFMAPVHEIYRIDGLRIRHFEEIENGGSYVAVSQGPFLHKQYGLLPEDREKWNINSKIESPEQSTLDSAESVDIYLKQRGYTSRTGLPFPFDGGVCVSHSLMDFGRNRGSSTNLSIHQHHNEQKSGSNNSKNDAKPNGSRKEQQKSNSESELECHLNSSPAIHNTELPSSIPEVESKAPLHEAGMMNDHNIEQNYEDLPMIETANSIANKTGESGLCNDIIIPNDRKPTVKKCDEFIPVPVVQIPDSSRDIKNMRSLGTMQTANFNDYPLPARNTETVITIVSDDALVRTGNSSVIIVNISTGQNKRGNINNLNKSDNGLESAPLMVNKVTDSEVPSENLEMKTTSLSDDTRTVDWMDCMKEVTAATAETRTPVVVSIDCASSATTTDRFPSGSFNIKDERSRIAFLKKDEDDQCNGESSKINSKKNSDDVLLRRISKAQAENFVETKFKKNLKQKIDLGKTQSDKLVCDASKNSAEPNEISDNLKQPASLFVRRNEFENISDGFEYDKENDITGKNQSSHICIAGRLKYRAQEDQSEDEKPATCTVSNPDKVQEFLTSDKSLPNKKHVTLTTPHIITSTFISSAVDTDMKLKMESEKAEIFSNPEGKLRSSPQHVAVGSKPVDISAMTTTSAITTAAITNTITSNNTTDITHSTATSRDIIMHTAVREKEVPNPQQRYHSESLASFEADFTPRHGRMQRNSTGMKTVQKTRIDLDLKNVNICRLPERCRYDPDFKDYDFMY